MSYKFNIVKKGYETSEVDARFADMEAELKRYIDKNSAINNAIINAQIAADNIIQNAKNQARIIKENSVRQLLDITNSIASQRQLLRGFSDEYNAMLDRYLRPVSDSDTTLVAKKIDALEAYLKGFSDELADELDGERNRVAEPAEPAEPPPTPSNMPSTADLFPAKD